jgi:hypothetical protein
VRLGVDVLVCKVPCTLAKRRRRVVCLFASSYCYLNMLPKPLQIKIGVPYFRQGKENQQTPPNKNNTTTENNCADNIPPGWVGEHPNLTLLISFNDNSNSSAILQHDRLQQPLKLKNNYPEKMQQQQQQQLNPAN